MDKKPNIATLVSILANCAFIILVSLVILYIIWVTYFYSTNISKITSTESNIEVLATLASIFVSITILVFVDIIRSESWKKLKWNKPISKSIALLLILTIYLLFGAGSTGIISSNSGMQSTITFIYISISMCAVILTILLSIFVYSY